MNDPRDDKTLQDYLAGDSPLSARYAALGDEQPPAELDEKILAAAKESSKVVPLDPRRGRWGASLAVAATVLLCVSVVVNLSIQPEGPLLGEPPPMAEYSEESAFADQDAAMANALQQRLDSLRRQAKPADAPARERSLPMASAEEKMAAPSAAAPMLELDLADSVAPQVAAPNLGKTDAAAGSFAAAARPPESEPAVTAAGRALAPRDDVVLLRAIDFLRAPRVSADALASKAELLDQAAAPAQLGAAILAAYDADDPDLAWERLQSLRADYPQHPLSIHLRDTAASEEKPDN